MDSFPAKYGKTFWITFSSEKYLFCRGFYIDFNQTTPERDCLNCFRYSIVSKMIHSYDKRILARTAYNSAVPTILREFLPSGGAFVFMIFSIYLCFVCFRYQVLMGDQDPLQVAIKFWLFYFHICQGELKAEPILDVEYPPSLAPSCISQRHSREACWI